MKVESSYKEEENNLVFSNLYLQFFESSPLAMEIYAANGERLRVNKAWAKVWRSNSDSNQAFNALTSSFFQDIGIQDEVRKAFKGREVKDLEIWFNTSKEQFIKTQVCLKTTITPVLDNLGQVEFILFSSEDITDRKFEEFRLYQQSKVSSEGIVLHNNGVMFEINQAILQIFNYDAAAVFKNKHVLEFVDEKYHQLVLSKIKGQSVEPYEIMAIRSSGERFPLEVRARGYYKNGSNIRVVTLRDMTKIKMSQNELHVSEERLKLTMLSEITGHFDWNIAENKNVHWDSNMYNLFGIDINEKHEDLNEVFNDSLHPEDSNHILDQFKLALDPDNQDTVFNYEFRIIVNGNIKYIEVVSRHFRAENGIVSRIIGSCRDITERKHTEINLKNSEEKLRTTLNSIGDGVIATDINGRITNLNPVAEKLTGWRHIDSVGKDLSEIFQVIDSVSGEARKNMANRVIETGEIVGLSQNSLLISKGGEKYHIAESAAPIRKDSGALSGVVVVFRDVTEEYKTQKNLSESEKRFRDLAELLPVAVFETDLSTKIKYINKAALNLFGIESQSEAIGQHGLDYIADRDKKRMKLLIDRNLFGLGQGISKFLTINKKGVTCPTLMYFTAIESETKIIGFRGVAVDITIQMEAERHAKEQNEKLTQAAADLENSNAELLDALKEAKKSKELQRAIAQLKSAQSKLIEQEKMASIGILTAGVAHEMNNPLNFILGGANVARDVISEREPSLASDVNRYFDMISIGVERASQIVNSLNRFNRTSDNMDEVCDVQQILENCLTILNHSIKHKVSIQRKYADGPCITIGNEGQLHQVFMNILSNAEQAIENRGSIEISTKLFDNTIKVVIQDDGAGIKEEHVQHVLEPFFTTKAPGKGTGLGMSLSNSIIREHEGKIRYFSEFNSGTRVEITLPSKA